MQFSTILPMTNLCVNLDSSHTCMVRFPSSWSLQPITVQIFNVGFRCLCFCKQGLSTPPRSKEMVAPLSIKSRTETLSKLQSRYILVRWPKCPALNVQPSH